MHARPRVLAAHKIGSAIRSLMGMRTRTFYDLDQDEKWKVWNAMSRAHERYKDWKYQCHKAYLKERPSSMPSDFIRIEDQWEFICEHFKSDAFKNDMVDEVNKRNDAFKEQHPDATVEEIMESVQSQKIEVLRTMLKTRKGKEIREMRRGGEQDLSHSSNGSSSRSRPPRVDEQQLQEVQERYEWRLKESEECA
ncbi:hypothetical protein ACLB2K_014270 [Fragaria x ananassa]